ncbi:MAG: hypothetical protein E6G68_05925, partial [Actinobacteria bacterium]
MQGTAILRFTFAAVLAAAGLAFLTVPTSATAKGVRLDCGPGIFGLVPSDPAFPVADPRRPADDRCSRQI